MQQTKGSIDESRWDIIQDNSISSDRSLCLSAIDHEIKYDIVWQSLCRLRNKLLLGHRSNWEIHYSQAGMNEHCSFFRPREIVFTKHKHECEQNTNAYFSWKYRTRTNTNTHFFVSLNTNMSYFHYWTLWTRILV